MPKPTRVTGPKHPKRSSIYEDEELEEIFQQEDDLPAVDDPEWEEAYASYLDARRRFAELKTNRGFYPAVALADPSTSSSAQSQRREPRAKARPGLHLMQKGGDIEHFSQFHIGPDDFQFRPTVKTLQFGGDRSMDRSLAHFCQWHPRSSPDLHVPGSTPLLIRRPILKAIRIQLNFMEDTMKVQDGTWQPIIMGPRNEHLLQLDHGLEDLTSTKDYQFDYMLEETFQQLTLEPEAKAAEHYTLWHYLELTGLEPPQLTHEQAMNTHDDDNSTRKTTSPPIRRTWMMMTPCTDVLSRTNLSGVSECTNSTWHSSTRPPWRPHSKHMQNTACSSGRSMQGMQT